MYNPAWLAYIRQARTWNPVTPYNDNEGVGPTVSRDSGQGSNCTGFVTSVLWELGYNPYYGNFPADGIDQLTKNLGSPRGGPYMTRVGQESSTNPNNYTLTKQSNILAWKKGGGAFEHVTIATYKDSNGWHIIHSSLANNGVLEEVIPNWYTTTFVPPTVYYWNVIGRGN